MQTLRRFGNLQLAVMPLQGILPANIFTIMHHRSTFAFAIACITLFLACGDTADTTTTLTAEEKAAGWQLLFDGRTLQGWHAYNQQAIPPVWQVKDGELKSIQIPSNLEHADLVTDSVYENFELRFEWAIERGGNSGVMINVQEDKRYAATFFTGPEYQLLDDDNDSVHRGKPAEITGAVYGVVPKSGTARPKPFGEWNESRIVQQDGKITFWLNGAVTATADVKSEQWKESVAGSSLHNYPDFGKLPYGRIALQDHIDEASFRAIKIKRL